MTEVPVVYFEEPSHHSYAHYSIYFVYETMVEMEMGIGDGDGDGVWIEMEKGSEYGER